MRPLPSDLPDIKDGTALAVWITLKNCSCSHKGVARNAKMAKQELVERYHHGYEEGLRKAMNVIVEKFGDGK
jgi:hypothetical protein